MKVITSFSAINQTEFTADIVTFYSMMLKNFMSSMENKP